MGKKKKVLLENYYLEKVSDFKPIVTQWHTPFCQYLQSLINSSISCSMTNRSLPDPPSSTDPSLHFTATLRSCEDPFNKSLNQILTYKTNKWAHTESGKAKIIFLKGIARNSSHGPSDKSSLINFHGRSSSTPTLEPFLVSYLVLPQFTTAYRDLFFLVL